VPEAGAATAPVLSPSASTRAVIVTFAASGFAFASWASRLPAVRDGLGYSEGQMGLLLLTAAIGSVLAIPLSGLVVERLGTRRTVVLAATVQVTGAIVAVTGVTLGEQVAVRVGLLLFGMGAGVWDAGMNVEGAAVEQKLRRAVMPHFHAAFSFGTVVGAGIGALAARLAIPIEWHVSATVVLALGAVLVAVRSFLPDADRRNLGQSPPAPSAHAVEDPQADPASALGTRAAAPAPAEPAPSGTRGLLAAWREPRTLAVGLVVLGAALTEGVANDWVSLAVVDGFDVPDELGALGLAVFLTAMTAGRLLGTRVTNLDGSRLTFTRATARHFAMYLSAITPFYVGYFMVFWTKKRQTLHDYVASTLVLRRE
jgi:MFS family permease